MVCSLKGCDRLSQAFSLEIPFAPIPRALPWAKLSDPFGVKTKSQPKQFNTASSRHTPCAVALLLCEATAHGVCLL